MPVRMVGMAIADYRLNKDECIKMTHRRGERSMRSIILSVALGLGILGFSAATPSKAQAYWILTPSGPVNVNWSQMGQYGNFFAYNNYLYRPYINSFGFGANTYLPASY